MKKIPRFAISRWICAAVLAFTVTNASAEVFTSAAVNTDETLLATVQGKTATLWDIASGEKKYEWHMPDDGWAKEYKYAGKIWDIAFVPQSDEIAIAGTANKIYFFDTRNGKLKRQFDAELSGTDNDYVIMRICIAQDGKLLATISRKNLILKEGESGRTIMKKDTSDRLILQCQFTPDHHLLTSTNIRVLPNNMVIQSLNLYQSDGTPLAEEILPAEENPFWLAIAPDGKRFAYKSGEKHTDTLNISNTDTLKKIQTLDAKEINHSEFARGFAWSPDGKKLYAGGSYHDSNGVYPVVEWYGENFSQRRILNGGKQFIQKIFALKNGKLIVVTAGGWLLMDENSTIEQNHESVGKNTESA
jgi:peptidase C14 caspase catalytic subunit p20